MFFTHFQVHQAVIDAGEEETGCTVHEVTEAVDGGPILVQKKVKVRYANYHTDGNVFARYLMAISIVTG